MSDARTWTVPTDGNLAEEVLEKTPFEERVFEFDFAKKLKTGDVLSAPAISTTGPTSVPTNEAATVSGMKVLVEMIGGSHGGEYLVNCRVTNTSGAASEKLELTGRLVVRNPS